MTDPRRVLVLANPASGGGAGRLIGERARAELAAAGFDAELALTRDADDVEQRARAAVAGGEPLLAIAGGDGTLHRALQAVAGSATELALLPAGRGNDLARALGIPARTEAAVATIVGGSTRTIDLGSVSGSGRVFGTVATLGLDAEVAGIVHRREVPGRGTLAYVLAALVGLARHRPIEAALAGDFGRIEGRFLLVATANTRSYGGGMRIAPAALPDDGLLDVVIVSSVSAMRALMLLPRVFGGGHVGHPAVRVVRTREIRIETQASSAVYADGEPFGTAPMTLAIAPGALRIRVPPAHP